MTAHPKVQQSGVDVYRVRPMIDDDKFNYLCIKKLPWRKARAQYGE